MVIDVKYFIYRSEGNCSQTLFLSGQLQYFVNNINRICIFHGMIISRASTQETKLHQLKNR